MAQTTKIKISPVVETMPADLLTPLAVYLNLSAGSKNSFLLESVEGCNSLARYSFIGADPDQIVRGNRAVFDELREHFATHVAERNSELPPFIGGAIGYFGFDCCEWFEPSLVTAGRGDERCSFMFYRSVVAFDHARQILHIISLDFEGGLDAARERNTAIRKCLEDLHLSNLQSTFSSNDQDCVKTADVWSNWTRADFENAVVKVKDLIAAGDCYQAVLSQCFTRRTDVSATAIYRALRTLNPSPYMFLLQFEDKAIVGSSPEMLVRATGEILEYRPIAGTRPRGNTGEEDDVLALEMRNDEKEVAEHMMLVDLGRNDLGRVAEFGSVTVDALMTVEKYSHVQHLVTSLSAKLAVGKTRFDAFAACFPAGTVSGAPKVRAIEIIRELEPTPRGVYAGAVGYFDYTGNMDTCIAIRTIVLANGLAQIQAGAGIVADSIPEREFDETVNKAKVLLKAIDMAEGKTK